jgi:hypothetical protein
MSSTPDAEWYARIDKAIAELNAGGMTDQEIARELKISQGVASYRRAKLGLVSPYTAGNWSQKRHANAPEAKSSRAKAAAIAIQQQAENAIPPGRGGDDAFARAMAGRSFENDRRLRPGTGYLPAARSGSASPMSLTGSTGDMCVGVGS